MSLKVNGKPAGQGCPTKELTGAPGWEHTPLTEALQKSRLGIKVPQFPSAAGRMAAFMRDVWTKTNHLKKKIKLLAKPSPSILRFPRVQWGGGKGRLRRRGEDARCIT
jgi:hypothetical protein